MNDCDVELAETSGGSHGFPRVWGRPIGDRWSEERSQWIRTQINVSPGKAALDQLARRDVKYLCDLRKAIVASRRNAP